MGSLPEGTLCAYCGVHETEDIIDGCSAPMCFGFAGSCWSQCEEVGWEIIINRRYARHWRARIACLAKSCDDRRDRVFRDPVIAIDIASYLWWP